MPGHLPRFDDPEPLGLRFFRLLIDGSIYFENLTLPRTFFGRSELKNVSFQNTDLTESSLCWNDFVDVDFTRCLLRRSDIRSSNFDRVRFASADLGATDMRRSWFRACIFDGALMENAVLTLQQGSNLTLSAEQRRQIDWRQDDGPEPDGG
jgi:uncharacterized protein YjbI with pentapeptide repeats